MHSKLSITQQLACDQKINLEECGLALSHLANNKSPGSDGFPADFYKFFWPDIKLYILDSYNHSFKIGKLSIDQRRGILTLIPKKDKDLRYLKNWRPLSLLNTDYKILTKILSTRLQDVINDLVSYDQNGYIKGRYIGENIRTISDIIEYTKETKTTGIIALLDFEKAFDTVQWKFLEKSLKTFNFGDTFVKWIKIIYNDISSCCLNNGNSTSFFKIGRGIRQGCPISALLFILVVEILAVKIRSESKIKGITVGKKEIKITQLADDTTLFLHDINSLDNVFKILDCFYKVSGLKLNKTKTEIFYLGNTNHRPNIDYDIKIVTNSFKALGFYFSNDIDEMVNLNLNERHSSFKRVLNMWSQRDLSLKGKITILKSLALPQLTYVTNALPIPDKFIKEVDCDIRKCVWSGKPDKIKACTLVSDIKNGGLKMPHFPSIINSQTIIWVKRLLDDKPAKWKQIAWELICIPKKILMSKYSPQYITQNISPFYRQVLHCWFDFIATEPEINYVQEEHLWNNKFILINNVPARNHKWQRSGLTKVKDLYDDNGILLSKDAIATKYNIDVCSLTYNSLVHAIPQRWKKHMTTNYIKSKEINKDIEEIVIKNRCIRVEALTNKLVYSVLIDLVAKPPTVIDRWISEFVFLNDLDFEKYFTLSYRVIRDTKLQTFQYKILHNIIPCGAKLFQWKITNMSQCQYCDQYDHITHFFYECESTKSFWDQLINWINNITHVKVPLSKIDILFGIPFVKDNFLYCVNFIILLCKWYIYNCKLNTKTLFLLEFVNDFKDKLVLEEFIMNTNGQSAEFINIWNDWYNALFFYLFSFLI